MNIFHELTRKPWLAAQVAIDDRESGTALPLPAAKLGLRVFLAAITVIFSALIIIYSERMEYPDWRPLSEPWLLWLNTGLLVLSSVSMQWALGGARREQLDAVRTGLLGGGILALAFLVGQLWAWQQLAEAGLFASTNPANAFFYLITGLHGAHLLGGLVAWSRAAAKAWRGADIAKVGFSVELCTVYWHYLLVVWLVLFGLMLFT